MRRLRTGAKNCSIGANCKSTCISNDKNCLSAKKMPEIVAAVKRIKNKSLTNTAVAKKVLPPPPPLFVKDTTKKFIPPPPPPLFVKDTANKFPPPPPFVRDTTKRVFQKSTAQSTKKSIVSNSELNQDFFAPSKTMAITAVPKLKTLSSDNKLPQKIEDVKITGKNLGRGISGAANLDENGNVVKTLFTGSKIDVQKDIVNQNLAASLGIAPKVLSYSENQITMERAKGDTVWNQRKMGDKDLEQNARNTAEMALTMHKAGITHNDSHAGNIMYDKETGKTQFIDFGMSKSNASINERFEEYQDRFAEHVKAAYGLSFESAKDYEKFLESV